MTVHLNTNEGHKNPYVHRLVCAAFNPVDDWENLQVDHKDNNKTNNFSRNLRFVSRKFNNSRKHARIMRMKNKKRTDHSEQYVKAFNPATGEIRYFKNGHQTAEAFGCSSPLVYMALDGKTPTCYGWKLEWISYFAPEVSDFRHEVYMREMERERLNKEKRNANRKRMRRLTKQLREKVNVSLGELHVVVQTTKNGKVVKEWKNARTAILETGVKGIYEAINSGDDGAERGGFIWKYKVARGTTDKVEG